MSGANDTHDGSRQTRRKRGLSLRSQLFNKVLVQGVSGEGPSSAQPVTDAVELGPITSPPQIFVDPVEDSKAQPILVVQNHLGRSTLYLSATSSVSDQLSFRDLLRPRAQRLPHNKALAMLHRLRKRVLGIKKPQHSPRGRMIPVLTSHRDINTYFNDDYYDDYFKLLIDERTGEPYVLNTITSSRYTVWTFLPKQLKAQFSKIANCYFMVVAILQMIPTWSTTGQYTTIIPLMIFMSISIAREGFDDWKRHVHDKDENGKYTTIVREDDELLAFDTRSITTIMSQSQNPSLESVAGADFTNSNELSRYNLREYKTSWKDVQVGDIIKIRSDEWVPADVVLLRVSGSDSQQAFVETMALDGETNLKPKQPPSQLAKAASKVHLLRSLKTMLTVEDPNIDLYNFEGSFTLNDESHALGPDNVIYRGSILRNTPAVLGVVVFTGEETKIRMNNIRNPRTKAPKLQRNINYIVIFMVVVVVSLSAFSTMSQRLQYTDYKDKAWYLYGQDVGVAATLMGFIIMYNTLIPLSLYVTMEIIKVMQLCFLQYDIDMYHVESNTRADAKTATILEELGQVSYIFSDKTGTLTDNKMIFRKFSIGGTSWIHDLDLEEDERVPPSSLIKASRKSTTTIARESTDVMSFKSATSWRSLAQPVKDQPMLNSLQLIKYIQTHPQTLFAKRVKLFLLSMALCNTCLPSKAGCVSANSLDISLELVPESGSDENILYQASSPDELALVQAARDLGFVVYHREHNQLTLKVYPNGFSEEPKYEVYEVLDVIEFSSYRKRMSVVVRFPDGRICLICKGADNIILERLRDAELAQRKAREISLNASNRKAMEAEVVLQSRLSGDSRRSLTSIRNSMSLTGGERVNSIDFTLSHEETEIHLISQKARSSLHLQQSKRYSVDVDTKQAIPTDRLLVNDEYVLEKTLEHIEEFSAEGLRTLLYSYKWVDKDFYDSWSKEYSAAKIALVDRAKKVEAVGEIIESKMELVGATAIEDKLQEGVSEAIDKLRRAGIKLWMLTGDKRETAINIGYSCRLIRDYSTVIVLSMDEGKEGVVQRITSAGLEIKAGRVAHCVLVIDGATLADIENDPTVLSIFIELCIQADSVVCCRASPSQKASMVSRVRELNKKSVTLAIGDGANDIAMIQSADIGIGITGKEGLQAARLADYAIAQFRFLLKLLLVNGRYNYVRTSKFVLCTFYKELLFYLTQAVYQRFTLFSGSSVYESWSLSMFNTLFTSLPVLCIGMFDKDLEPSTLIAVPELYAKGREYQAFNLRVFIHWMILAAVQSVGISFLGYYSWAITALRDNTTLPIGTLMFAVLVIVINAKCEFIEMQNRQWLAFAAFIISVGGYGLWNVLIMALYRAKTAAIFYVDYGLTMFGQDPSWWAALLMMAVVPMLIDILLKVFKFMFRPSDDDVFRVYERDLNLRRYFEQNSLAELHQGWQFPKDPSSWRTKSVKAVNYIRNKLGVNAIVLPNDEPGSAAYRKRAGTETRIDELPPSGVGEGVSTVVDGYETLPSGARVKIKTNTGLFSKFRRTNTVDADAIIARRMSELERDSHHSVP